MAVMMQKVAMMAEAESTSSTSRTGKRMRYLGVKCVEVWTCMQEQHQPHREEDEVPRCGGCESVDMYARAVPAAQGRGRGTWV